MRPFADPLLRRHPFGLLAPGHILNADRLVGLERALEIELLRHLAHRREHFLAEQPDARLGILMRHGAVIAPEREDAGPRLLQ